MTYRFKIIKEESPGFTRTQCQITPGGGDPRDSATENKPPYQGKGEKGVVRAHRLIGNNKRMENPHWKQDQVEMILLKTKSSLWLVIRVGCSSFKET